MGSEGGDDAPFVGWLYLFTGWALACVRQRRRAGPAPERARQVRFLRAVALLVAVLLRAGGRARPAATVRHAAVLVRGARAVAAIREGLSGVLPEPGAAARPQHRLGDARPDAGAAAHLP